MGIVVALAYWAYIGVIFLLSASIGYTITAVLSKRHALGFECLTETERLVTSFGFSVPVLVLSSLLFKSRIIPVNLTWAAISLVMTCFCLYAVRGIFSSKDEDVKFLLLAFMLQIVLLGFIQAGYATIEAGGDWALHGIINPFRFSEGILNYATQRPPLFSIMAYTVHMILKTNVLHDYWITQSLNLITNSILFFPAYLIADKIFGKNTARLALLLLVINPFIAKEALYTWPKNLAAYYVFLMFYFMLIRGKEDYDSPPSREDYSTSVLGGFFGGLGYLSHSYAAFPILSIIIITAFRRRLLQKTTIISVIILSVTVSSHFLLVGKIPYYSFRYYPFATGGFSQIDHEPPEQIFNEFFNTPIQELILIRLLNLKTVVLEYSRDLTFLVYLLSICWLLKYTLSGKWAKKNDGINKNAGGKDARKILPLILGVLLVAADAAFNHYTHSGYGAMDLMLVSLGLIPVLYYFTPYVPQFNVRENILVSFILLQVVFFLLLWGWVHGVASGNTGMVKQTLNPTVPLLAILAADSLLSVKSKDKNLFSKLKYAVILVLIVDGWVFNVYPWLEGWSRDGAESLDANIRENSAPPFNVLEYRSAQVMAGSNLNSMEITLMGLLIVSMITLKARQNKSHV